MYQMMILKCAGGKYNDVQFVYSVKYVYFCAQKQNVHDPRGAQIHENGSNINSKDDEEN